MKGKEPRKRVVWEKPSYRIITVGCEITAYVFTHQASEDACAVAPISSKSEE